MLIWRYKPVGTQNFGDALNDYLWPQLLHPNFASMPGTFYGIGTVLSDRLPPAEHHTVFGAGVGYHGVPTVDDKWRIYFVRGPHTAKYLGGCRYITDPGILVQKFHSPSTGSPVFPCSFMPRWDSTSQELFEGCDKAGIHIIDPRWSVPQVIADIRDTELLLTEALHGAVVADALRVPWISIYGSRGHEFKWQDWCASMSMVWTPIDAEQFTLSWARDTAVPQLSARSVLAQRTHEMFEMLDEFNYDLEAGDFA